MCKEFSFIQFPGVALTDVVTEIAGITYPINYTVADLINNNPQFWVEPGLSGVQTLTSYVQTSLPSDITMIIRRGQANPFPVVNAFIKGRPNDR